MFQSYTSVSALNASRPLAIISGHSVLRVSAGMPLVSSAIFWSNSPLVTIMMRSKAA